MYLKYIIDFNTHKLFVVYPSWLYHFANTLVDQSYRYIVLNFCVAFGFTEPINTDHTMIYAHRRHKFTLEKVHTNILHLGLEWLFFRLHIHLQYITDVLLVILNSGFAVAGVRTSGTSHFTIGQNFSGFFCPTDKAIWSKKNHVSNRKQI